MVGPIISSRKQLFKSVHYPLLKDNRPPQVSIGSLTRDAAARLPDFVGTRFDVAILLLESQYIADNVDENELMVAVSGSLNRISTEKDPPVRYDRTNKVWVYLHGNRSLDSPKWE